MPINLSNGELLFYNSWNEMIPCGNQSRLTSCIQTSCKYGSGCHHFRSFPPQTLCLGHGFAHQKVPKILEAQTGSRHGESSCLLRQKYCKFSRIPKEQNDQTGEVLLD